MKQPEFGKAINHLRNLKGLSQKELADECHIDIRTIQRIESGEVYPRNSTLRLLRSVLQFDEELVNGSLERNDKISASLFLPLVIAGFCYFISWFFLSLLVSVVSFPQYIWYAITVIYTVAGILF